MPIVTRVTVELAKNVFELAGADQADKIAKRARLSSDAQLAFFIDYPSVEVVMETCGSAHYWGHELQARDNMARLLPAKHVKLQQIHVVRYFMPGGVTYPFRFSESMTLCVAARKRIVANSQTRRFSAQISWQYKCRSAQINCQQTHIR